MRSKKLLICLVFLFVSLFAFNFNVKAATYLTSELITVKGAQVRTSGNAGLRFVANEAYEGETSYGIILAYGEAEANENFVVGGTVNGKAVGNASVATAEEGEFKVTLWNIPELDYETKISARAYVVAGGEYVYSSTVTVRSLADVVKAAYAEGNRSEFVVNVYKKVSAFNLNYNGGSYVAPYEFKVTRLNTGSNTGYYATISESSKASSGSSQYWNRILVKATETENLYKVVEVRVVANASSSANYTGVDFDYIIATHASCYDKTASSVVGAFTGLENAAEYYAYFEAPTETNCDVKVALSLNPEYFMDGKLEFDLGETLPNATKAYYDFAGWYDNAEFEGEAATTHTGAKNYYAKYTPTVYTITYHLNGGETSATLVESYTVESETIVLPIDTEMTLENGTFIGWFDNENLAGEALTEITAGSNGNIELYASWNVDTETIVELSDADTAAITALTPDKIVNTSVKNGAYIVNGVEYKANETAFATIAAALAMAEEGDNIYVFAGTYSAALTVSTANVTLYGPNYNIKGKDTRSAEAVISAQTDINGAGSAVNGLKFTSPIRVGANNVTITNSYVTPTTTVACNGQNRKGCIVDSANISNLTVSNCYIDAPNAGYSYNYYVNQFMSFNNVTNLTITGNYITNSGCTTITGSGNYAGMRYYTIGGTLNITNNEFHWATNGYVMYLAGQTNNATEINILDNLFDGNGTVDNTATICISKASSSSCKINIIGNELYNFKGNTYSVNSGDKGTWTIMYNYYASTTSFKFASKANAANASFTISNNYYAATQTTSTSDYGAITSLDALKEAYAAYKAQ